MTSCLLCAQKTSIKSVICSRCLPLLPVNNRCCQRCGLPLEGFDSLDPETICEECFRQPPPFLSCRAPFLYLFPVNQLISQMKYHNHPQLSKLLAQLMADQIKPNRNQARDETNEESLPLPELLVPVPMHPAKERQRGFNQANYLARHLGKHLGIPVLTGAIRKVKSTGAQNPLTAEQRRRNLQGAFRINPAKLAKLRQAERIGLVDDVITTAATVTEISQILSAAGAAEIHLLAIARTP